MRITRILASFVVASLAGVSGMARADSAWTNPDGGSWVDPANWSNGVPGAADTALLPALDADGYTIDLAPGVAVGDLVVSAAATLVGGTLGVSQAMNVGSNGAAGSLTLSAVQATAGQVQVGANGGTGELTLRDASVLQTSHASSAFGGAGTIEVRAGSTLVAGLLELFAASELRLWTEPDAITPVIAAQCARGGALVMLAEPAVTLPASSATMVTTWTAATGSFSSIVPPTIDGYLGTVSVLPTVILFSGLDPVVQLDIVVEGDPPFVGCSHPLDAVATKLSGLQATYCCDSVAYTVSPPSAAAVTNGSLVIASDEPFTLTAEYVTFGVPVQGSRVIQGSTDYPYVYENVASNANGEPANSDADSWPGSARWTPDGRHVAFVSAATNLVEPDPEPSMPNVFVKDRVTGAVELVDLPPRGIAFGAAYGDPDISADARYVTFVRKAVPASGGGAHAGLAARSATRSHHARLALAGRSARQRGLALAANRRRRAIGRLRLPGDEHRRRTERQRLHDPSLRRGEWNHHAPERDRRRRSGEQSLRTPCDLGRRHRRCLRYRRHESLARHVGAATHPGARSRARRMVTRRRLERRRCRQRREPTAFAHERRPPSRVREQRDEPESLRAPARQ